MLITPVVVLWLSSQAALDDEEFGLDGGDDDAAAPAASAPVAKPAAAPAPVAAKPVGIVPYQYTISHTLPNTPFHIPS